MGGRGTIAGLVTVGSGGTVKIGVGTLTLNNGINFSATVATYDWELSKLSTTTGFDQLSLTGGNLTLAGGSSLNVDLSGLSAGQQPTAGALDPFWAASRVWDVAHLTGTATNTGLTDFTSSTNTSAGSNGNFVVSVASVPSAGVSVGDVLVTWTPTPVNSWQGGTGTDWNTPANWTVSVPNGQGAVAKFYGLTANTAVTISSATTVGTLAFTDALGSESYTISGTTLTLDNTTGVGHSVISTGSTTPAQVISAPLQLANTDLDINNLSSNVLTISGGITETGGSRAVNLLAGTVVLSGASTYSGQTALSSSTTLRVGGTNGTSPNSTVNMATTSKLDLNGFSTAIGALAGAGTVGNSSTANNGVLTVNGTSNFTGVIQNTLGSGTMTTGLTVSGGTFTVAGTTHTYTGPTTINNGATMHVTSTGAIATGTTINLANGTFNLDGQAASNGLNGVFYNTSGQGVPTSLASFNTFVAGQTIVTTSNSTAQGSLFNYNPPGNNGTGAAPRNDFPAPYNVGGTNSNFGAAWSGYFYAATTGSYTFNTLSDDNSMIWLDNNNTPVVSQTGCCNTVSGNVTLTAGYHPITIGYEQGGGGYYITANVQVPSGSLVSLPNSLLFTGVPVAFSNAFVVSGSGTIQSDNGVTFTGGVTGSGTLNLTGAGNNTLSTNPINTTSGAVNITGTGTWVFTGAQPYPGATTISLGATLQLGDGNTAGSLTNSAVTDNGTLAFAPPVASPVTYNQAIAGGGGVTQLGPGTLTLGAASSYLGATAINGGTLRIAVTNALPVTTALTVSGTLDLNGLSQSVTSLGGAATGVIGNSSTSANGTLIVTGWYTNTFSGVIKDVLGSGNPENQSDRFRHRHADPLRHEHLHRNHHAGRRHPQTR